MKLATVFRTSLLLAGCLAEGSMVRAQGTPDSTLDRLAEAARAGTTRYRDRAAAIADGYRAIGPEAPAMGQHWVNPRLVIGGGFDPARPSILMYATIAGRAVLVGVAYARALGPDDPDPEEPVGPEEWHFHSSTVNEEALLSSHAHHGANRLGAPRVAVLHAWVWLANPDGLLTADNWALPFARIGLALPSMVVPDAARALALAAGGAGFFGAQYQSVARLEPSDRSAVDVVLERHAARVRQWLAGRAPGTEMTTEESAWLAGIWKLIGQEIENRLSPAGRDRLRRAAMGH